MREWPFLGLFDSTRRRTRAKLWILYRYFIAISSLLSNLAPQQYELQPRVQLAWRAPVVRHVSWSWSWSRHVGCSCVLVLAMIQSCRFVHESWSWPWSRVQVCIIHSWTSNKFKRTARWLNSTCRWCTSVVRHSLTRCDDFLPRLGIQYWSQFFPLLHPGCLSCNWRWYCTGGFPILSGT